MEIMQHFINCLEACTEEIKKVRSNQAIIFAGAVAFLFWEKSQGRKIEKLNSEIDILKESIKSNGE